MAIDLQKMKQDISKTGASKGKVLYFKGGEKRRIRFLNDLEDGLVVPWHSHWEGKQSVLDVPCQELLGKECEYCEGEDIKTKDMYIWSIYDYETKEVRLIRYALNNCSPVPSFASFYETYGTLLDRDFEVKKMGERTNTSFGVVPLDKMKFRNTKAKAYSEQAILKILNKAYPDPNATDDEDEEEEKPKRKAAGSAKQNTKKKPEPKEDEWEEEEELDMLYEEMTAKELYQLCKERDIDCKIKKPKQHYIDLLEEQDEEQEDEWEEEEELPFN